MIPVKKTRLISWMMLLMFNVVSVWADDCVPSTISTVVSFGPAPEGILPKAVFSVSASRTIIFSKGNLQYRPSTQTWRFAEHQWDFVGNNSIGNVYENNVKCSNAYTNCNASYTGWLDNFEYAASGYNNKYPYTYVMGTTLYQGTIAETSYDWGVYNPISNGGNEAGLWRVLTYEEWLYLFTERQGATDKIGHGVVNGVNGLILLPDKWTLPEGLSFNAGGLSGYYSDNEFSETQWEEMENNGAVFLPACGLRYSQYFSGIGEFARYWSSTYYGTYYSSTTTDTFMSGTSDYAYCIMFGPGEIKIDWRGYDTRTTISNPVRLVLSY